MNGQTSTQSDGGKESAKAEPQDQGPEQKTAATAPGAEKRQGQPKPKGESMPEPSPAAKPQAKPADGPSGAADEFAAEKSADESGEAEKDSGQEEFTAAFKNILTEKTYWIVIAAILAALAALALASRMGG